MENIMTQNLITALYCRLSRKDENDGESESILNQKKILQDYAKRNNYRNTKFYVDDGYSGMNFNRPAFQELIRDIEEGLVGTVIVKDMSRFGRNYLEVGYYTVIYFEEKNIHFIGINDGVDNMEEENDFTPFRNIVNEWHARDISRKYKAAKKYKAESGKHIGGVPPFGYRTDPNDKQKWLIDEPSAQVVQEIFSLYLQGYGPYQIADILNKREVKSPILRRIELGYRYRLDKYDHPEKWIATPIRLMLSNQEYTGCTISFRTKKKSYKDKVQVRQPREDWLVFENTQEPIIDQDTFDRAQGIMQQARSRAAVHNEDRGVFYNKLYCADCGKRMYLIRCKGKLFYFNCSSLVRGKADDKCESHYVPLRAVEKIVLNDIRRVVSAAECDRAEFIGMLQGQKEIISKNEMRAIEKEFNKVRNKAKELDGVIELLFEDRVSGKITEERFDKLLAKYEEEQAEYEDRVAELESVIGCESEKHDDIEKFMSIVDKYTDIQELTQEIVDEFIDRIIVHKGEKWKDGTRQVLEIVYNCVGAIPK